MFRNLMTTLACAVAFGTACAQSPSTPTTQMEMLTRGVVAVPNGSGNFVSWRLLGTDNPQTTTFNLYRDGSLIAQHLKGGTCFEDAEGTATSRYRVETLVDNQVTETSAEITPWSAPYLQLHLQKPDPSVTNNDSKYTPNDCSAADVDGDGEYELIVKWDPCGSMPSQDNSKSGKTGNVILDCYKISTGNRLWSINLGPNIRAGAHYTQFLAYDFDGDGKAEIVCKTAPWSKDGQGHFVSAAADDATIKAVNNSKSYRNSKGYVLDGPEFLTIFNGETGAAIHTIYYHPNRGGTVGGSVSGSDKSFWGDNYGGRCDRFLATVAYLGGANARPSAVMVRGYYTRCYVWAVDFDGQKLSTRWLHASVSKNKVEVTDANGNKTSRNYTTNTGNLSAGSCTAYGNGNHNLSCADVDGDGKDEIIMGSSAIDDDGQLLYATGMGHGDAMHLGDLDPGRPGLEVFDVHEEKTPGYGWDLHDAATGEILYSASGASDNGRGLAADIVASNEGYEFWSSNDRELRSAITGDVVSTKHVSVNFRIYWDGDLQDELLDGTSVSKFRDNSLTSLVDFASTGKTQSCNSTKKTPCLVADLFGDWREEYVGWSGTDSCTLNIFTTTLPTDYRIPTLMHDHTYRMAITWQQSAYNQPPHLGYYLPYYAASFTPDAIREATVQPVGASSSYFDLAGRNVGTDWNRLASGVYIIKGKKYVKR